MGRLVNGINGPIVGKVGTFTAADQGSRLFSQLFLC